jgi:hypothetical protein
MYPRRVASFAATSIFVIVHLASNARLVRRGQGHFSPLLTAVAGDRIPVAFRFILVRGGNPK